MIAEWLIKMKTFRRLIEPQGEEEPDLEPASCEYVMRAMDVTPLLWIQGDWNALF
jgi:hypothetical protein